MAKLGRDFEEVVAKVLKTIDPRASVTVGKWVHGPDGRRELDVLVEGSADGTTRRIIVECKDFNPKRTGPVGIFHVDALDSKTRDIRADTAILCSNAGFTADAIRKARRLEIGLISVLRKGDPRIRYAVIEEIYTRRIRLERLDVTFDSSSGFDLRTVPFEAITFNGIPVANWAVERALLIVGSNPIVKGSYKDSLRFITPLKFDLPEGGSIEASGLTLRMSITGEWFAQVVTIDATAGIFDWLHRRVRLAPGPTALQINGIDLTAGEPIEQPPASVLRPEKIVPGEIDISPSFDPIQRIYPLIFGSF